MGFIEDTSPGAGPMPDSIALPIRPDEKKKTGYDTVDWNCDEKTKHFLDKNTLQAEKLIEQGDMAGALRLRYITIHALQTKINAGIRKGELVLYQSNKQRVLNSHINLHYLKVFYDRLMSKEALSVVNGEVLAHKFYKVIGNYYNAIVDEAEDEIYKEAEKIFFQARNNYAKGLKAHGLDVKKYIPELVPMHGDASSDEEDQSITSHSGPTQVPKSFLAKLRKSGYFKEPTRMSKADRKKRGRSKAARNPRKKSKR